MIIRLGFRKSGRNSGTRWAPHSVRSDDAPQFASLANTARGPWLQASEATGSARVWHAPYGRERNNSTRRITIAGVYSAELLDHFQNPRNAGEVEAPDSAARLENPACGDILELTLKLEGSRVADIRFRAKGCVPAIACGSAITQLTKGKTIEEARQVSREELAGKVGGLPQASAHASHLAMDTLAALLRKL
jgi:nitrogen fixation NifU-like protein